MSFGASFITMTVDQLFEQSGPKKKVWTKRGGEISKRDITPVTTISSRTKIEPKGKQ